MIQMLDLKLEYEYMKKDIDEAVSRCMAHQQWIFGPEVKALEENIASYIGAKHAIGASSGTEALVLSLRALAIKIKGREYWDKEDKIITTPFTFTATGDAILRAGATPVFVDIDPDTFNIDPRRIDEYITKNPKGAVGIIPVHLYGRSCGMDGIMDIASKHKLFVVEDIAQAFGASYKGRKLGSIGTTGCFSFFPSKNLGGFGDGGMITAGDDELASIIRMLIKHGGKDKYNVDHIGYNARLDTLQAAVVLAKFKYIDEFNGKRRAIAVKYGEGLNGAKGVKTPVNPSDSEHVFHQYTLRVSGRDAFQTRLKDLGVSSMVYYPFPLHKMKVFDGRCVIHSSGLKHSEEAALEVLSLPIEPLQDEKTTQAVIEAVRKSAAL